MCLEETVKTLSCADCHVKACRGNTKNYPAFCPAKNLESGLLEEALDALRQPEDNEIALAAAEVEWEGYGKWCRIEDTIAFARKLGAKRIGVATCLGLLNEARVLTRILRAQGFEPYVCGCKTGAVPKTEIGIDSNCAACGVNMCNPVLQAKILNEKKTQLNIVFGLCVGHDSLFYKHSEAVCTTLVAKDRVTGHNPAAPLYLIETYYKKLLEAPFPPHKEN